MHWIYRAAIAVVATVVVLVGAAFWDMNRDHATYPSGYTEAGFGEVRTGMDAREIRQLIGEPLEERAVDVPEAWWYGSPPTRHGEVQPNGTIRFDLSAAVVYFDTDGLAKASYGTSQPVQRGSTREDVRRMLGEPAHVESTATKKWLYYSEAGPYGRSEVRVIGIDDAGVVTEIIREDTVD